MYRNLDDISFPWVINLLKHSKITDGFKTSTLSIKNVNGECQRKLIFLTRNFITWMSVNFFHLLANLKNILSSW